MKTIIAASVIALMSSAALAGSPGPHGGPHGGPPMGGSHHADSIDLTQVFIGIQAALNKIDGADEVDGVDQAATNAANLVSLEDETIDKVNQAAAGAQIAANYVDFSKKLNDVTQEATNVLNVVSASEVTDSITQSTGAGQAALNVVQGVSSYGSHHHFGGMGGYGSDKDISNVTQDATNAANLVSVADLGDDLNVLQTFSTGQLAANYIGAIDGVSGVVQNATNVANSIGSLSTSE